VGPAQAVLLGIGRQTRMQDGHQISDGDRVWSVVDWTMQPVPGTLSAAEVLEIRDGQIVRGELFYDAEELRKAMAQGPAG
jgi:hypothetical protein